MSPELRGAYHRELDKLDVALATLLGLVPDAIGRATAALLTGDPDLSAEMAGWRSLVEDLYADVDATIELVMARQAPVARDLRFLMCAVRVIPEVRDGVELIAWVAGAGRGGLADRLTARMRRLTLALGDAVAADWTAVDRWWRDRAGGRAGANDRADAFEDIYASLTAEVASGLAVHDAIEMALVGSAYERLDRHAAAVARLVGLLVSLPE